MMLDLEKFYMLFFFTLRCLIQRCRLVKSLKLALLIEYGRVLNDTLIYTGSHDSVFFLPSQGEMEVPPRDIIRNLIEVTPYYMFS